MQTRRTVLGMGAAAAALLPFGARAADADTGFYALLGALKTDEAAAGDNLSRLRAFDPDPLTREARLDYDGIVQGLDLETALRNRFPFGTTGATISPYVVSPRSGAWLRIAAKPGEDPALIADIQDETRRIQDDARSGAVPPDFIIDATLAKLGAAKLGGGAGLTAALDTQIAALTSLRAGAAKDAGVWRLPRGDDYYAQALMIGTSLPVDPAAAHAAGLAQVRELSARADPLLRKQGLHRGSVGARLHALGRDKRHLYSDDDAGRAKAVAEMNARLARVHAVLGKAFAGLAPGTISVQRAGPGKIGYREAPSYRGDKPGAYYVDLRDIQHRPSWSLASVVHHETLPGHLLQLPLQEHANPPALRLRYTSNAYFEGWAIYAEQLADELGLFDGDDLGRLGFLQSVLVRAGRLVVDTGIHFKRWTREEAIARFFAIAGDAPDTFENEVDRMVVQPGYTAGPALGRATILALRQEARTRPGFALTAFHQAVLQRGALRLTMLQRALA